jgi:hypothetical protein
VLELGELPRVHRRRSKVADLAGTDDVVQRLHRLFDRCLRVEAVNLVEVDVVGTEAGEGGIDLFEDCSAGQTLPAGAVVYFPPHLGGEDDVLSAGVPLDRAADKFLRRAGLIGVGGVPEGDA